MFMPILNAYSVELEYEALIIKKLFGENLTIDNYLFHTSDRLFRQSERSVVKRSFLFYLIL